MIDLSAFAPQVKKPLAVVGLGKSGLSVFAACRAAGIETVLWDDSGDRRAEATAAGAVVEDLTAADFSRFSALCLAPGIPYHLPKPHPCVLRAEAAGVEVIGDMEIFHRAKPASRTVGITGTNGKSTTTALTGHILKEAKVPSAVGGNIGEAVLSLPDLGAEAVYVFEISSYQVDLCPTFTPGIAAHINFSADHLDRHGGMEGYVAAKERMFNGPGTAIIGVDDDWSRAMCDRVKAKGERDVVPVSCLAAPGERVTVSEEGILYDGAVRIADLNTCPNLKGAHNWQNAAIAYGLCRAAGVAAEDIIKGMQSYPGLAHRQNIVADINGVLYVNDSKATNDQASAMALRTFDPIYWIAGGRAKDGGYTDCEKHLSRIRHAYLIGEAEKPMAAWLEGKGVAHTLCGTLDKAVEKAHAQAQADGIAGAAVLLSPACASWDQFRNFEHRGDVFVEAVRALGQGKRKERA